MSAVADSTAAPGTLGVFGEVPTLRRDSDRMDARRRSSKPAFVKVACDLAPRVIGVTSG